MVEGNQITTTREKLAENAVAPIVIAVLQLAGNADPKGNVDRQLVAAEADRIAAHKEVELNAAAHVVMRTIVGREAAEMDAGKQAAEMIDEETMVAPVAAMLDEDVTAEVTQEEVMHEEVIAEEITPIAEMLVEVLLAVDKRMAETLIEGTQIEAVQTEAVQTEVRSEVATDMQDVALGQLEAGGQVVVGGPVEARGHEVVLGLHEVHGHATVITHAVRIVDDNRFVETRDRVSDQLG